MSVRSCRVTIQDLDGTSHTAEVTASSLFEAVAGDDLAKSLMISTMIQKQSTANCQQMREAASVAQSAKLKESVGRDMQSCPSS